MKKSLIERIGEKLPDINIIFLILTGIVLLASFFLQGEYVFTDLPVAPGEDEVSATVVNMFSVDGLRWMIMHLESNFMGYAPLGLVLVSVVGTSIAEKTGLFGTLIQKIGSKIKNESLLIPLTIFLGVMSSIASDVGYVVLLPLAGMLFAGLGKNPLLGILSAFAGVSAGFAANLFPTPGDALLGGITLQATEGITNFEFNKGLVTMNLYFMIASTFIITLVGWFVTVKFIKPKLEQRKIVVPEEFKTNELDTTTAVEKKGLRNAGLALLAYIVIVLVMYFSGICEFAYNKETGEILSMATYASMGANEGFKTVNLLLDYLIVFMIFAFLIPGFAYGVTIGKIKSGKDFVNIIISGLKDNAGVIAVAFFAGNFISIFTHSGIGNLISCNGANFLYTSGLGEYPILLLIVFILLTAFINLFIGSASAKWILLAPIFVPMLYQANNSMTPDVVQAAYRVADSSTNIISPLMTYMPIIMILVEKFDKDFNLGTMINIMSRYAIIFLITWTVLFIAWFYMGLPFGI